MRMTKIVQPQLRNAARLAEPWHELRDSVREKGRPVLPAKDEVRVVAPQRTCRESLFDLTATVIAERCNGAGIDAHEAPTIALRCSLDALAADHCDVP